MSPVEMRTIPGFGVGPSRGGDGLVARAAAAVAAVAVLFTLSLLSTSGVRAASFYGTSHVYLPLSQASTETNIQLILRTSRSKGLLLLAAGDTDYWIVQLRSGIIETRINLGDGELLMRSQPKQKLNDLKWHSVRLKLTEGRVELYVDGSLHQEGTTIGAAKTLYIQDGIYIGGIGNLKASFLSSVDRYFRGCIENATYNDILVFNASAANQRSTVNDVTWDCSKEFEAAPDSPISFVRETAFVLYPRWQLSTDGSFACWLKTTASLGLLMFSSASKDVFIAAEIVDGRVRVLMARGADIADFTSEVTINDGNWHWLKIAVGPSTLRISIDYEPETMRLSNGHATTTIAGMLYVGGVIHKARSQAYSSELRSITHASNGGSFQGCLRDVEVNDELFTLGDSRVTHGILIGCVYKFPCIDVPCAWSETCTDTGPETFACLCVSEECRASRQVTTIEPQGTATDHLPTEPPPGPVSVPAIGEVGDVFTVVAATVEEGQRSVITSDNILLNLNLRLYGLRKSQLLFHVSRPPLYGQIENSVLRRGANSNVFTLLDLSGRKIFYRHDGSEHFYDEVTFAIEVLGQTDDVPELLRLGANVTMGINISPVNDVPRITLADDATLRMIQGSVQPIRASFLEAVDPDDEPGDLLFTIVNQQGNVGYFQTADNPGTGVVTFTQADVNKERVSYVHTGPMTKSRIVVRISDGDDKSPLYSFRIDAVPLRLSVVNATELRLNPGSIVQLAPSHLYVATNDPEDASEVVYRMMSPLKFGKIQQLGIPNWWVDISRFTRADVARGQIRYSAAVTDKKRSIWNERVMLSATSGEARVELSLPVKIVLTSIEVTNNTGLILDIVRQGVITRVNLSAEVRQPITQSSLTFTLVRPPSKGQLIKQSVGPLSVGDSFTQDEIILGELGYRLNPEEQLPLNDTFLFQVSIVNAQSSVMAFTVTYIPDIRSLVVTNVGFTVAEGGTHTITMYEFLVTAANVSDFVYTITEPPSHGELLLSDLSVTTFLNYDLTNSLLMYRHDDSETRNDSFSFETTASYTDLSGTRRSLRHEGVVKINVLPKNDHEPKVIVNRLFKVVSNGKTPLTDQNLLAADGDSDFNDDDLEYRRQNSLVGDLIYALNDSAVFRFKQHELSDGMIAFKHRGDQMAGRMLFFIFDDDYSRYTTAFLDIEASDAFVDIPNNTGLHLSRGSAAVITPCNLSAETNLGIKDKRIEFVITSPPSHGQILDRGAVTASFNQGSLQAGRVAYQHDNSSEMLDSFNFTVHAKDMIRRGVFNVRIYLESHQNPPKLEQFKPLVVVEGEVVTIDRHHLRVTHPNHLPVEIVFTVTVQPKYGILQLLGDNAQRRRRQAERSIKTFTQLDVNRGRLQYVQTRSGNGIDTFTFQVDNGFVTVPNISFTIEIAPTVVPLQVTNIALLEGGTKAITREVIHVAHPYYRDQIFDYVIEDQPSHGFLETTRDAGEHLQSFSTRDVLNEFIYFVHDGTDTLTDNFTIIAVSSDTQKESLPYTINVTIAPVNDEFPEVIANAGLTLFVGSQSILSAGLLAAVDLDTSDDGLTYILTSPTNGHVAKLGDLNSPVLGFTQADLNDEQIVFVHSGSRSGGFRFSVSDGVHSTTQQVFTITANPLLLHMQVNTQLYVKPNSIEPITPGHLSVVTNEEPATNLSRPITFTITRGPQHGIVVEILDRDEVDEEIVSFAQITTFTQDQVDRNVVAYKQILEAPVTEDQFWFELGLPLAQTLTGEVFEIAIGEKVTTTTEYVTTTEPPLVMNRGIEVEEGGVASITGDQLNIRVLAEESSAVEAIYEYNIVSLPEHGTLKKSNMEIGLYSTFMQEDLAGEGIQYVHDHSDERWDAFNFTVTETRLGHAEQILVYRGQFVVTIDPINDQPFRVVTPALSMSVVQGSHTVMTANDLNTVDADNPPDEIRYELFSGATNGEIVLTHEPTSVVGQFTQQQINDGEIMFAHDGGLTPGGFLFHVTDGAQMKLKQFSILVEAVVLDVQVVGHVVVSQGEPLGPILPTVFNVSTNFPNGTVLYNVTVPPKHGAILVDGLRLLSFSQAQLDEGLVQYSQTDFLFGADSFTLATFNEFTSSEAMNVTVNVKPGITVTRMNITTGDSLALTPAYLNATELAQRSSSRLQFEIVESPVRGLVLNATSNLAIREFTYADLVNSKVLYIADYLQLGANDTLNDSFVFVLSGDVVQPVQLLFFVKIEPAEVEAMATTIASRTTVATTPVVTRKISIISFGIGTDTENVSTRVVASTSVAPSGNSPDAKSVEPSSFNPLFVVIPLILLFVIVVIAVLCVLVWRWSRGGAKHVGGRESPYPEPEIGPYPGAQAGPGQTGLMPTISVMMPCPDHRTTGSLSGTPPVAINRPMPITNTFVPQVTVMALGRPPSPNYPATSFVSINSNGTVRSGGSNQWSDQCDQEVMDHCRTQKPTLKKSQYWV